MHETTADIGFEDFASYPVGSTYEGVVLDNDWFTTRINSTKELTAKDIEERTGIQTRGVASPDETVKSMAEKSLTRYIEENNLDMKKCKHVFLSTTAVDAHVLGADDVSNKVHARVQRTAEEVAAAIGIGSSTGTNLACSGAAAIAVDAGMRSASLRSDDNFFLAVASEKLSAMTDFSDPNTGFLFGDMVAVWKISRTARLRLLHAFHALEKVDDRILMDNEPVEALDFFTGRSKKKRCIRMPQGGEVMKEASDMMVNAVAHSLKRLRELSSEDQRTITIEDISNMWVHEANRRFAVKKNGNPGTMCASWKKNFDGAEPPPIDIDVSQSGNNGAASWLRRMADRNRMIQKMAAGTIVTAPLAGAYENMTSDGYSYGNMLFEIKDGS